MRMPTVKPIIQIGNEQREMTDAEFAQYQIDSAEIDAYNANKAAARQAVLVKLGLTANEAAALLG
jgi:hypothetical protein